MPANLSWYCPLNPMLHPSPAAKPKLHPTTTIINIFWIKYNIKFLKIHLSHFTIWPASQLIVVAIVCISYVPAVQLNPTWQCWTAAAGRSPSAVLESCCELEATLTRTWSRWRTGSWLMPNQFHRAKERLPPTATHQNSGFRVHCKDKMPLERQLLICHSELDN